MGKSSWPPGFRFHPTDEELILYYLKRKICRRRLKLNIIAELDVYKQEPEELPGLSLLKNGDRQWFYFSPRDRKYPNGQRSNRSTKHGYWKATGKDRIITCNSRNVGLKKTLVFYRGRAPSGERTDWVMHEYTLDEDELRRCRNAQDYYAIYKLFKKSGPGPKNGEQYGAPFREEDWVDDDDNPKITSNSDQANHVQEVNNALPTESCRNEQANVSLDDIDEVMNRIIAEPTPQPANDFELALAEPALQPIDDYDFEQALSKFVGKEDMQSTVVHESFSGAINLVSSAAYPLSTHENVLEGSLNISQATTGGLESWHAPEVTSTANRIELPGDTDEDFLEMDDLLGPDPNQDPSQVLAANPNSNSLLENSQFQLDDGLGELDFFYDADLANDLLPSHQGIPSSSGLEWHQGGFVDQSSSEMQLYTNSVNAFGSEMWTYANTYMPTATELNQEPVPQPTTGVVYGGNSASIPSETIQNSSGNEAEGSQPWFSSTLWSIVESIPAAPASAAESALVNKTFQRILSFSRVRINNAKSTSTTSSSINTVSANPSVGSSRIKSVFVFSFLVAIFAFVCVFIGSNVNGFGKVYRRMNL